MTAPETEPGAAQLEVRVLGRGALQPGEIETIVNGAGVAVADCAVLEVTGSGAIDTIQGLVTNDVTAAGGQTFVYGAVLTPKGMIITDLWILRLSERLFLFVPPLGLAPLWEVFRRYVPPRLATITDRTGNIAAIELVGPMADDLIESERLPVPPFEYAGSWTIGGVDCAVGSSATMNPFVYLLTCPSDRSGALIDALYDMGFARLSRNALEAAHLIAGWPMLGVEIRDKTLPQEVNFDRLAGVSYTKGCYTGQETVARLHFRGHSNRRLTGLMWKEGQPDFGDPRLMLGERPVGHVTRALWVPMRNEWVGLGMIRREVEDGETVHAAGRPAVVMEVPMPVRIG